jgi:hypothetical protein
LPALQRVDPFATAAQATLQPPQWSFDVWRSTHCLPHRVGADAVHPLVQVKPLDAGAQSGAAAPQTALQMPQWLGCARSVSHPVAAFWSQSA